jgi:hypothetical protein
VVRDPLKQLANPPCLVVVAGFSERVNRASENRSSQSKRTWYVYTGGLLTLAQEHHVMTQNG